MTSMTISDFKDALTRAGKTKGAAGVTLQKKLLLDNYMIVDADGLAVDPETLDVHLIPSESAPAVDEVVEASTEAAIAKSIRSVISSEFRRIAPTANSVVLAPTTQSFKSYGKLKAFSSKEQAFGVLGGHVFLLSKPACRIRPVFGRICGSLEPYWLTR